MKTFLNDLPRNLLAILIIFALVTASLIPVLALAQEGGGDSSSSSASSGDGGSSSASGSGGGDSGSSAGSSATGGDGGAGEAGGAGSDGGGPSGGESGTAGESGAAGSDSSADSSSSESGTESSASSGDSSAESSAIEGTTSATAEAGESGNASSDASSDGANSDASASGGEAGSEGTGGTDGSSSGGGGGGGGGATTIETGDAQTSSNTLAQSNANQTSVATDGPATVAVENANEMTIENSTELQSQTGENSANENPQDAEIDTGNAIATANIVNVINTNVFNSTGFILLLNALAGISGNLDLRSLDNVFSLPDYGLQTQSCSIEDCSADSASLGSGSDLTLENNNAAEITNDVVVRSATGANSASSNEGDARVRTGSAFAAANLINIVNTNLANTNYALVVINNFADWAGDLVFPSANSLSRLLSNGSSLGFNQIIAENTNEAVIENIVSLESQTGENEAKANGGQSTIDTGSAASIANVADYANQNIFNSDSIVFVFRIFGDWSGSTFGAPDGLLWSESGNGLKILSASPDENSFGLGGADVEGSSIGDDGTLTAINNNRAAIRNNVSVIALTGTNRVSNNTGNALIETGDATAIANILNVANTNVMGRNWIFAMINIFGNWSGNLSFGQPNLWIGSSASVPEFLRPGSAFTYKYTIKNFGDVDASNVKLTNHLNSDLLTINQTEWNLGTIPAGGSIDFSFESLVNPNLPEGVFPITMTTSVTSDQPDENLADNTDELTIFANGNSSTPYELSDREDPVAPTLTIAPNLIVTKANDVSGPVPAGTGVNYTITIKNYGGPGYNGVLTDTITDENGEIVDEDNWNLGEIKTGETITITYTMAFGRQAKPGKYTNRAVLTATGGWPEDPYGYPYNAPAAQSEVMLTDPLPLAEPVPSEPEVQHLPASIAQVIEPLVLGVAVAEAAPLPRQFIPLYSPSAPISSETYSALALNTIAKISFWWLLIALLLLSLALAASRRRDSSS